MPLDIHLLIGGEAGQGLVTIGQLLSKALVRAGYEVFVSQSYHSRIRGGHNNFAIRLDTLRRCHRVTVKFCLECSAHLTPKTNFAHSSPLRFWFVASVLRLKTSAKPVFC